MGVRRSRLAGEGRGVGVLEVPVEEGECEDGQGTT